MGALLLPADAQHFLLAFGVYWRRLLWFWWLQDMLLRLVLERGKVFVTCAVFQSENPNIICYIQKICNLINFFRQASEVKN